MADLDYIHIYHLCAWRGLAFFNSPENSSRNYWKNDKNRIHGIELFNATILCQSNVCPLLVIPHGACYFLLFLLVLLNAYVERYYICVISATSDNNNNKMSCTSLYFSLWFFFLLLLLLISDNIYEHNHELNEKNENVSISMASSNGAANKYAFSSICCVCVCAWSISFMICM